MAQGTWGEGSSTRIFRVNVKFTRGNQRCQTGFYLRDVGIAGQEPEDVAEAVEPWVTEHVPNLLHTSDSIQAIDVLNIVSAQGHEIPMNNLAGAQSGDAAASFVAFVVSLKSAQRRRYGQGRMLWPVASETAMFGNVLLPAQVVYFQAAVDALLEQFTGPSITTDLHLVNVHKALPALGGRPAVPASWYDVTSARINTTMTGLRRRRAGVGQ